MYSLVKNQPVQNTGYFVAQSGDYEPLDLVPCSQVEDGEAIGAFLAVFIATGLNEVVNG